MAVRQWSLGEYTTVADHLYSTWEMPDDSAWNSHGLMSNDVEDINDEDSSFKELTKLSLSAIQLELPSLSTQSHHLSSSLSSLSHSNYKTFIGVHDATKSVALSVASLSSSTASILSDDLPSLQSAPTNFTAITDPLLQQRARTRNVLEYYDKIRELLDIPVLINTCIHNGYYADALSLASHANSLSSSLPPEVPPIIQSLQNQVSAGLLLLLRTLLQTIYEPNRKLPALWKAVTFLRRMNAMHEDELALAFLIGRGECLIAALDALGIIEDGEGDGEAGAKYLRKYIDVWREGVHDIIVQFTSIFLSPQAQPSTSSSTHKPSPPAPELSTNPSPHPGLRSLLAGHAQHFLTTYLLSTVKKHLQYVPISSQASILTQLTYCGAAFARVGLDFRLHVGDIVRGAVRTHVLGMFSKAEETFVSKMEENASEALSHWLVVSTYAQAPPSPALPLTSPLSTTPNLPPTILASYPPLAALTNSLLDALNVLRLLAPLELAVELWSEQERTLRSCAEALLRRLTKTLETASLSDDERGERERKVARAAGLVYVHVLVPFFRKALITGVYGMEGVQGSSFEDAGIWKRWDTWLDGSVKD